MTLTAVASLVISVGTLLLSMFSQKFKADKEYVRDLETRIKGLEVLVKDCESVKMALREENMHLLRKIFAIENAR